MLDKWAERDEYGAGYKEAAENVCEQYGVAWYEYLNYFLLIDGNIQDDAFFEQSVNC